MSFNLNISVPYRCRLIKKKNISRRAFLGLLQMLKPKSFRGRCPLDSCLASAPGPCQGSLSGPLDPTPIDTPLASLSWIVNFLALPRRTNTKFVPMGLGEGTYGVHGAELLGGGQGANPEADAFLVLKIVIETLLEHVFSC